MSYYESPFGTIYTDHRLASGSFFAVDPNGIVSADDANSAVYLIGLDALFRDRSFVRDDCDCDYCNWEHLQGLWDAEAMGELEDE